MLPFNKLIAYSAGNEHLHAYGFLDIDRLDNGAFAVNFRHYSRNRGNPRYERRITQACHVSKRDSLRETQQVHLFDGI